MSQMDEEAPLPPKDQFEDDSDDDEQVIIDKEFADQSNEEKKEQSANQVFDNKKITWIHKWVKVDNICATLPPVFIKKWVRNVEELQRSSDQYKDDRESQYSQDKSNLQDQKKPSSILQNGKSKLSAQNNRNIKK